METQEAKKTLPAMPAAIKKTHRPTLQFKTNIEIIEEKKNVGRYCIIEPK
jgi:hypothetical protein